MREHSKPQTTDGREFEKGQTVEVEGKGVGEVVKVTKTYVAVRIDGVLTAYHPRFVKAL